MLATTMPPRSIPGSTKRSSSSFAKRKARCRIRGLGLVRSSPPARTGRGVASGLDGPRGPDLRAAPVRLADQLPHPARRAGVGHGVAGEGIDAPSWGPPPGDGFRRSPPLGRMIVSGRSSRHLLARAGPALTQGLRRGGARTSPARISRPVASPGDYGAGSPFRTIGCPSYPQGHPDIPYTRSQALRARPPYAPIQTHRTSTRGVARCSATGGEAWARRVGGVPGVADPRSSSRSRHGRRQDAKGPREEPPLVTAPRSCGSTRHTGFVRTGNRCRRRGSACDGLPLYTSMPSRPRELATAVLATLESSRGRDR